MPQTGPGLPGFAWRSNSCSAPKVDVSARLFARRALTELEAALSSPVGALPPLQGLSIKGDVLGGFVDLPSTLGAQLLQTSGSVRGVFVRPWLGSSGEFPLPPGFTPTSHRVLWVRVTRYNDILFAGLRAAQVDFAGLICPRKRGEVGVRVPFSCDPRGLCECIQADFGGQVKIAPAAGRRVTLRASGVPLALLDKLPHLVAKADRDLRIVESRVVRTTYDSLLADLVVEGKDLAGDEWRFSDLGMRTVVIKKLLPRRPAPVPAVAPCGAGSSGCSPASTSAPAQWCGTGFLG